MTSTIGSVCVLDRLVTRAQKICEPICFHAGQFSAGGGFAWSWMYPSPTSQSPRRSLLPRRSRMLEDAQGPPSWNPGHASLAGNSWLYTRALYFSVKRLVAVGVVFSSRVSSMPTLRCHRIA